MKFKFVGPHEGGINVNGYGHFAQGDTLVVEDPKDNELEVLRFARNTAYWEPADADARKAVAGEYEFAQPEPPNPEPAPAGDSNEETD